MFLENIKTVSQDSELGVLGLSALLSKGFCGPNFDLSDFSVTVEKRDGFYTVDFYDMSCEVWSGDSYYKSFSNHFKKDEFEDQI